MNSGLSASPDLHIRKINELIRLDRTPGLLQWPSLTDGEWDYSDEPPLHWASTSRCTQREGRRKHVLIQDKEGSDPSPLRLVDETSFTEFHLPDRERQPASFRPAISMLVLPGSRVYMCMTTGEWKDSPTGAPSIIFTEIGQAPHFRTYQMESTQ